jgi:hypothetical protein
MAEEKDTSIEVNKEDTIRIVRIVIKCSDLLTDYDTLVDYMQSKKSVYIKHELKKKLTDLGEFVDRFSSTFLKPFVEADEIAQMELQGMFTDFTKNIFVKDEELTALILMYSKCSSILHDISEMEYGDLRLKYLHDYCKSFCTSVEKKYQFLFLIKDKKGYGVTDIVNALNDLGKKIMYSENKK